MLIRSSRCIGCPAIPYYFSFNSLSSDHLLPSLSSIYGDTDEPVSSVCARVRVCACARVYIREEGAEVHGDFEAEVLDGEPVLANEAVGR